MPDEPCPCSWIDKAKAICLVIGAMTTAAASITAAVFSAINNGKTVEIREHQAVNAVKIDQTEQAAREAAAKNVEELFMKEE